MNWYRGKKVLITGGSSGIGEAAAAQLVAWGADVLIAARGTSRLNDAAREIRATEPSGRIHTISLDISDPEAVRSVASPIIDRLGGLDILINNAGVAHPGTLDQLDDSVFESMMNVNALGTMHVTRAFFDHFRHQRSGHICNVSSLLGVMGVFGYSAYAASKFAITGFSDCLRQELLPYGVGVSVLFPPDTDTPQLHEENRLKPPETRAITGSVRVMAAEAVAKAMLRGLASGSFHIYPGFESKFVSFMYRHFPSLVRWVMDRSLKKYVRTQNDLVMPRSP